MIKGIREKLHITAMGPTGIVTCRLVTKVETFINLISYTEFLIKKYGRGDIPGVKILAFILHEIVFRPELKIKIEKQLFQR